MCDAVYGVNRAALQFACDWWVALDRQTFERDEGIIKGDPKLLTRAEYRRRTNRGGIDVESLYGLLPHTKINWPLYSTPAALVLATYSGAKQIDVYGCDWALDRPDFDGITPADSRRDVNRWAAEMVLWGRVVDWANEHGTTVTRHGTPRRR